MQLVSNPRIPGNPSAAPPDPNVTVIRPESGWQLINFAELWHNRDLLYFLTWRDVKVRYKQTLLGAAWAVLQPGLMMIVFTIFFGRLANVDVGAISYPLFVYGGLLPWTFFATALSGGGNSVVGQEKLVTKIYFPRLAIPFAAAGAAVIDLAVACGLLLPLMLTERVWPGWSVLMLPFLFVLLLLAGVGMGTLLAALNVAYRDVRYVIPFLVQLWMFATPSIYMDITKVSTNWFTELLLTLNPLTGLVAGFRSCVLGTPMPWGMLAWDLIAAPALFLAGCFYFRKIEDRFADVI